MPDPIISAVVPFGTIDQTAILNNNQANYTLVVQVPVPIIKFNIPTLGSFVLPVMEFMHVPKSVQWLVANATVLFQNAVDTAIMLIKAIPQISVTILVKVGPLTVLNVKLVAVEVPVDVGLPSFVLALPNISVGLGINLNALIPVPPPIIIKVPVPVPKVHLPVIALAGGKVTATISVNASNPTPTQITNPVKLPII